MQGTFYKTYTKDCFFFSKYILGNRTYIFYLLSHIDFFLPNTYRIINWHLFIINGVINFYASDKFHVVNVRSMFK